MILNSKKFWKLKKIYAILPKKNYPLKQVEKDDLMGHSMTSLVILYLLTNLRLHNGSNPIFFFIKVNS